MTEPQSLFFRSGELRMHALRFGDGAGRDLVVVPGITTPAYSLVVFARQLAAIAGVGAVYVLDTRGRGLSERSPFGTHSASAYADDVLALIEAFGLDAPILVGHSMGARVVASARVRFPGCSTGVVAIDPPLSGPGKAPYPIPLERMLNGVQQARAGQGRAQAAKDYPAWSEAQANERGDWLGTVDDVALVEAFAWFHLELFEPTWQRVPAPALLLAGGISPVVTGEGAASLAALNPQARVTTVEGAGHMVPWDNAEQTLAEIAAFVDSVG